MFEGLNIKHWTWQVQAHGIVQLYMDSHDASVNTFSSAAMTELGRLVERLAIDPPAGVIILSAKKKGYIAGANIDEFADIFRDGKALDAIHKGQKIFDQLERLSCPTVAAIDGFCMGGGTEMALACDHRIASDRDSTRIGLPEVMLGIHPGWGGTVRLPRLVGAPKAMDMILTGRGLRASAARKIGLVDKVCSPEKLIEVAESLILKRVRKTRPPIWIRATNWWPARQILAPMISKQVARKANPKHYPAPFAAIKLWKKFGGNPRKMMRAEARSMEKLAYTSTAHHLIRVFHLREALQASGRQIDSGVKHVHVIGAGVMGGDIAAYCALKGLKVTLQDREEKYVKPAMERAVKLFEKKLRKADRIADARSRLTMDIAGDGVAEADLIIEAIFENLEAKQSLFVDVEAKAKPDAILASNTSSIPLSDIAGALKEPKRMIGLHFFNPVAQMPLLEIVTHETLDETILNRSASFTTDISKLGVPVTGTPGFLVNRVLMPYLLEAMILYREGVPGAVIDKVAKRFGMPMGPIELADQIGLDVCASVSRVLSEHLGFVVPDGLEELVASAKRGKKDGQGFYTYPEGRPVKPEVPEGYTPPADLEDRLILPYLNECVACLRENVVANTDLLDAGMIFGTGFAPFRGGPCQYISEVGTEALKDKLKELAKQHGERFEPDAGWDSFAMSHED